MGGTLFLVSNVFFQDQQHLFHLGLSLRFYRWLSEKKSWRTRVFVTPWVGPQSLDTSQQDPCWIATKMCFMQWSQALWRVHLEPQTQSFPLPLICPSIFYLLQVTTSQQGHSERQTMIANTSSCSEPWKTKTGNTEPLCGEATVLTAAPLCRSFSNYYFDFWFQIFLDHHWVGSFFLLCLFHFISSLKRAFNS